jgi:prepilin peptidase CpaA
LEASAPSSPAPSNIASVSGRRLHRRRPENRNVPAVFPAKAPGPATNDLFCLAVLALVFKMTAHNSDVLYASAALLCAATGAACDIRTRRIPNLLTGPSILLGLLLHLALGGPRQLGWSAAAGLIGGGIFLVFHLAGGMGAGDVKLMTAVACLAGYHSVLELLVATAIMGGVFAIVLAASRGKLKETFGNTAALVAHHRREGLKPHPALNLENTRTLRLPYGVAIAAGCLITFFSEVPLR